MALETDRSPRAILEELASHPQGDDLARLVHTLSVSAFDERRTTLGEGVADAASRLGLRESDTETSFGNVLRALGKEGRASGPERVLLGALVARGVALFPPTSQEAARRVAETLAWTSAHTVADPLAALEDALTSKGEHAIVEGLFAQLAALVREHDSGEAGAIDRAAALLAALAVARFRCQGADALRTGLLQSLKDPLLRSALARQTESVPTLPDTVLNAEEAPLPRSSAQTFLLTITFILPVVAALKLFARYALRLRQPAEVAFSKEGVRVRSRLEILGKTLRQKEVFIAANGLSRAAREVRFASLPTYVGIASLLLGSYLGLRLVLDGFKGRSPEFIGLGVVILVAGLGVDYLLTLLPSKTPDRCRIRLEPQKGKGVLLIGVDRARADEALRIWLS